MIGFGRDYTAQPRDESTQRVQTARVAELDCVITELRCTVAELKIGKWPRRIDFRQRDIGTTVTGNELCRRLFAISKDDLNAVAIRPIFVGDVIDVRNVGLRENKAVC